MPGATGPFEDEVGGGGGVERDADAGHQPVALGAALAAGDANDFGHRRIKHVLTQASSPSCGARR